VCLRPSFLSFTLLFDLLVVSVTYVREICEDGSLCEGLEVNIPLSAFPNYGYGIIFRGCHANNCLVSLECATLQSVVFLQSIYGFTIIDYSYGGLVRSRSLYSAAVEVATAALRACRRVVDQGAFDFKLMPCFAAVLR
jgi:hypothetical protein